MMKAIEDILYSDKNPLRPDKRGEDYYKPALRQLSPVEEEFDAHYQITFDAPLVSTKVKLLKRSIDNAIATKLNELFLDDEHMSQNRVLFIRKKLYESICSYLSEIKDVVNRNNLDLEAFLITKDYSNTLQLNESTFVFHYLILALIRCYMEFQRHFIEYIEEDKQESIDDFFVQVLQKRLPSKVGIKEIVHIDVPVVEKKPKKKGTSPEVILAFRYTKLQAESDNINKLFAGLKTHGALSKDLPITEFKHLFSGVPVSTPIPWVGNKSDLYYLFKLLMNVHKVLDIPNGTSLWKVVDACFVDASGKHFGSENLRIQKVPKKTKADIEHFAYLMS